MSEEKSGFRERFRNVLKMALYAFIGAILKLVTNFRPPKEPFFLLAEFVLVSIG